MRIGSVAISGTSAFLGYTALRILSVHLARKRYVETAQASFPEVTFGDSVRMALRPATFVSFWEIPADLGLVGQSALQFSGVGAPCYGCRANPPRLTH